MPTLADIYNLSNSQKTKDANGADKLSTSLQKLVATDKKNSKKHSVEVYQVSPKLMFVGQVHGQKATISPEVKEAARKYGGWYEGNGDDRIAGVEYEGSWDDELAKDVRGYPKEFLFVIFTNTAINEQKDILKGSGSIFDRILKTQNQFGYFKKRKFKAETLIAFLKQMGFDYLEKSRKQATQTNVAKFIDDGEKEMWESGKTAASEMAEKANKYRDEWLLKQPQGVYFVGSDHLKELKQIKNNKKINN